MKMTCFILENSFAFIRHNKKTSRLIVLSLVASLLPLYIALTNIQYFISLFDIIKLPNSENVYVVSVSNPEEAIVLHGKQENPVTLKQYEKIDFIHNNIWMEVTVTYVDDQISLFENFKLNDVALDGNDSAYSLCAIEKNLQKFYDLSIDDIIKVNGKEYRIAAIVSSVYNLQSIILPRSEITDFDNIYENVLYLDGANVPAESPTIEVKTVKDVYTAEITNGVMQSMSIVLVGCLLLVFAITNISMIFIGEFEQAKFSVGIRRLLGAEMQHIHRIVLLKNIILILVSDVIVYVLTPGIIRLSGTTIDVHYSFCMIVIHIVIGCLIAFLLTSGFMRRMKKYSLIEFMKSGK